jgi:FtsP/CotA-like multicopper oxidase with cupredoxin domain
MRSNLIQVRNMARTLLLLIFISTMGACGKYPDEINMGAHTHHQKENSMGGGNAVSCSNLTEPTSNAPVKSFDLTAAKTFVRLKSGKMVKAWTFNGTTPGPELRVREGDRVVVKLTNKNIEEGVTIHWHGVVLPCSQDGVPGVTQDVVRPGEQYTYEFVAKHPGTYWYHSHQLSSEQVKRGLIGRLIVEPKEKTFHYDRDYAVILQRLGENEYLTNGQEGGLKLEATPGETVRLRLINAYNRVQWMGVAGASFQVVSIDGHDLNEPDVIQNEWIPIGGGQRYDILFTMPDNGQVRVYSKKQKDWTISLGKGRAPKKLSKHAKIFDFTTYGTPKEDGISPDMHFDRTYDLVLGPVDINGKRFHDIPPIIVKEGEWVKVRIEHKLGAEHPMHLHGHIFKILTKNGKPLSGSPIYADSVLLFQGDVYEIAFQANNPGLWMEHCHNLNHAAAGMSMMVNYEGVTTPFWVGTKSGNFPD